MRSEIQVYDESARSDHSGAVVEYLSVRTWIMHVVPWLLQRTRHGGVIVSVAYVDASPAGRWCAQWTVRLHRAWPPVTRFCFRLIDLRDAEGLLLSIRIAARDIAELQHAIAANPQFAEQCARWCGHDAVCVHAVQKDIAAVSYVGRGTLYRAMILIHACDHDARRSSRSIGGCVLFLEQLPWLDALHRYAAHVHVRIVAVPRRWDRGAMVSRLVGARRLLLLRMMRNRLDAWRMRWRGWRTDTGSAVVPADASRPCIAVEYSGQMNLETPGRYSDLFFYQQSALSGSDLLVLFPFPQDPLDDVKMRTLTQHGIRAAALYPGASTVASVLPFHALLPLRLLHQPRCGRAHTREERWIQGKAAEFSVQRHYWQSLFYATGTRVFVSWFRYDTRHYAMTEAIRALGGISTMYQRAVQDYPSPAIAVEADVMFGYAPFDAAIEQQSGSRIPYHVAVGYLHDHCFPALRSTADGIRAALRARGVRTILAYFDENSIDDDRWHTGHAFMRENYISLLEHVLADATLGLVLKPKHVVSLRRRLGPVVVLLEQAIATGRCHLFEAGTLYGSYPPAVAALAADIAIHGHASSPTAGFEAALLGVPTLLLDREGWSVSPLYALGVGMTMFTNWNDLWAVLQEHRTRPGGVPHFGDWSSILATLDPFQDGRAAERMGTYLKEIFDGLQRGRGRDTVLEEAAERYIAQWGADKVTRVHPPT